MPQQPGVLRVFISSTFLDMHEEREELVKRVFPRLRQLCEERGVIWGEVDLRWGITDEQKAEGRVLPICLAEIQRCRPYFIALLGERYGWIPDRIPPELVEREPWLASHTEHSITAMEIVHGALDDPEMANRAYFYLRDPDYARGRPEFRETATAEEIARHGRQDAERRAEVRRRKLAALKERIRASGFAVREDYPDPRALGDLVLADLTALIEQLYPADEALGQEERDAILHEAFAAARTDVHVGRDEQLARLERHVSEDGPPLTVVGDPGDGKSSLLANFALRHRRVHPDQPLLMHFVGSSSRSTDWIAMLRRLLGDLKRVFDLEGEIPDDPQDLPLAFSNWLHQAASRSRFVLILDGLNQLEDRNRAPDLIWLPPGVPDGARLILSMTPGRGLEEIERRAWPTIRLDPLMPDDRRRLVRRYLSGYAKSLPESSLERIVSSPQAGNPLFLRTLLEELRLFGDQARLDERIAHYLEAEDIPSLFERVLDRWEMDYERDHPGLVGEAMSLIWAARNGLAESELLEMLGQDDAPLPAALWSPLRLAAGQTLVDRSGLLSFSHWHVRDAVARRYLDGDEDRRRAHRRLANLFRYRPPGIRRIEELPWQLAAAGDWTDLRDVLKDLDFAAAIGLLAPYDLRRYWVGIQSGSDLSLLDAYRSYLERPPGDKIPQLLELDRLLVNTGHLKESLRLRAWLCERFRETGQLGMLASMLALRADVHARSGELDESITLLDECREQIESAADPEAFQIWLGAAGLVMHLRGRPEEALVFFQGQADICRSRENVRDLRVCLHHQCFILIDTGRFDEAERILADLELVATRMGDLSGYQSVLGEQALCKMGRGDHAEAERLLREQRRVCEEIGDRESLATCLGNLAGVRSRLGAADEALQLFRDQEALAEEIGNRKLMHTARFNQAGIQYERGEVEAARANLEDAILFFRQGEAEEALWPPLTMLGHVLLRTGEREQALGLYREAEEICERVRGPGDLAELRLRIGRNILGVWKVSFPLSGGGLTSLEAFEKRVERAELAHDYPRLAEMYFRSALNTDPGSAEAAHQLGEVLEILGRRAEAIEAYEKALELRPDWTEVEIRLADLLLQEGG